MLTYKRAKFIYKMIGLGVGEGGGGVGNFPPPSIPGLGLESPV